MKLNEFVQTAWNTPLAEITAMQFVLGILAPVVMAGIALLLVVGLGAWVFDIIKYHKSNR